MTTITPAAAVVLVRKNLDELDPNGSVMYSGEDNTSLDNIIKRMLPEAINMVHLAAPIQMLEGKQGTISNPSVTDGVLSFSTNNFLRLVSFKASDSDIVITDPIPEASPEGRKQLNPYIRGRYDRPRLVRLQAQDSFRYYSLKEATTASDAVSVFLVVEEQTYNADAANYEISYRLRQNIIDCLTAKVMETYNDQRAQSFYQKANDFK